MFFLSIFFFFFCNFTLIAGEIAELKSQPLVKFSAQTYELVRSKVAAIPKEDREFLNRFFSSLVLRNEFGYALFADKPISLTGYFLKVPLGNAILGHYYTDEFIDLLAVWKKYASYFPSTNFILIDEPQSHPEMREFVLINKAAFIKKFEENISDFEAILGEGVTAQKLLARLEQPNANLKTILQNHEGLLGILLGYGRNNAFIFQQRDNILRDEWMEKPPLNLRALTKPSPGYSSTEEEFKQLHATLQLCGEHCYSPLIMGSIHFAADLSDRETQELMKKYTKQRGEISSVFTNGHLLEIVLAQLIHKDD